MDQYDVIVVGAGNGGLVAAATVAQAGYKTLLLEKHNLPGGCATSFVRGRFEFEAALHELCFESTAEELDSAKKVFENLGADIPLVYEDTLFRAISTGPDGFDVVLHTGKEQFLDDMEKAVPGCRDSVAKLFDLVDNIDEAQVYMADGKMNPFVLMKKYGDFLRAGSHSVDEVERHLGIPDKARAILNTYWGYLGVPTDDLNALHYFSMWSAYTLKKPSMPKNRSHELSLSLVKALQSFGGEIRYNCEVTEFLFDDQNACIGVAVGGEKFFAKKVISNIMPSNVINRTAEGKLPKKMNQLANARKLGMTFTALYIGLDRSMEELGINDYSTFIMSDNDSRVQYDNRNDYGIYVVNCLNKVLPDSSPKGTCTLFFTILHLPGDMPQDLTAEGYKKYKTDLAEKYVKHYEKTLSVNVSDHIEEIVIATPVTFARYLGTPDGAIYGYASEGWDNIIGRIALEPMEFNVKNLHFCGGHHTRGDGYPSGYMTGDQAGKAVIQELKEGK